jgi:hypothetical protein
MAMLNLFILTAAESAAAVALNGPTAHIYPRPVDNGSPGVGLNLNDQAVNYAPGAPVPLVGTFVANKRMVDDPVYLEQCPALIAYLLTLPFAALEPETIFLPEIE